MTSVYPEHGQHYGHREPREYIFQCTVSIPVEYENAGFTLAPFRLEIASTNVTLSATNLLDQRDLTLHRTSHGNAIWNVETRWQLSNDFSSLNGPLIVRILTEGTGEGALTMQS